MNFQPRRRVTPNPALKSLSETKKLRREDEASKLKKKGNLKQFLFNAELFDEVNSITEDLQTQDTDSANKAAKRTIKLVQRRQKLIKLADKSEAGWLAVDEYESLTSCLRRFSCLWFRDKSGKEHLVSSTVSCLAGYCLEF